MKDYEGTPLKIGDTIKNIESGWRGVIESTENFDANAFDGGPDLMLVCLGVNRWTGEIDADDRQWHAPSDVIRQRQQAPEPGEAPSATNFL